MMVLISTLCSVAHNYTYIFLLNDQTYKIKLPDRLSQYYFHWKCIQFCYRHTKFKKNNYNNALLAIIDIFKNIFLIQIFY